MTNLVPKENMIQLLWRYINKFVIENLIQRSDKTGEKNMIDKQTMAEKELIVTEVVKVI